MALFASIVGIALVDSLNPSLFIAQFYLLTTPRPVPRILSYIAGLLLVNFLGGVLILTGARAVIGEFFASIDPTVALVGQLMIGAALVGFGLWFQAKPAELGEAKKPRSLQPIHTFVLGMGVMINELTTALPYFVAIERIASAGLPAVQNVLVLVVYNFVFALPLFGFLGLFLAYRERFAVMIERVRAWLAVWTPRVVKWGALGLGLFLVVDGVF